LALLLGSTERNINPRTSVAKNLNIFINQNVYLTRIITSVSLKTSEYEDWIIVLIS
jgi:hypothetical protein